MNVYDFDKTIYYPDSSHVFSIYCLKKYPLRSSAALISALPKQIYNLLFKRDATLTKEFLFSYLKYLPDVDSEVIAFWDEHFFGIGEWYLKNRREDDLIISASPDFLVRPAAERLGVRLIASTVDKKTGKYLSENCHDEEKVRRFELEYPGGKIEEFYSDSFKDTPLAELAERAYMVKKDKIIPWPKSK